MKKRKKKLYCAFVLFLIRYLSMQKNILLHNLKKAAALYMGNLIDHYDGALFAFLSPIFAAQFFPETDYLTALILTYAMLPLGVTSKVIGAFYYGRMGDKKGSMHALCHTLFGISSLSICMAALPTYQTIGAYAPLMLLGLRLIYNFFSAAESTGGAISFINLSKKEEEKDVLSSLFNTSTIGGILAASSLISLFYYLNIIESAWRTLYLLGGAAGLFGYFLRKEKGVSSPPIPKGSFCMKEIWASKSVLIAMTLASAFSYACYAMAFMLMNTIIPLVTPYTHSDAALTNTSLLLLDFILLPFFGYLSARIGRNCMMMGALGVAIFSGLFLFPLLSQTTLFFIIIIRLIIVGTGVAFSSTYHSWALSIAPPSCSYSAMATTYALGSRLLGSSTPALSLYLFKETGSLLSMSAYWIILAIATGYWMYRQNIPEQIRPLA